MEYSSIPSKLILRSIWRNLNSAIRASTCPWNHRNHKRLWRSYRRASVVVHARYDATISIRVKTVKESSYRAFIKPPRRKALEEEKQLTKSLVLSKASRPTLLNIMTQSPQHSLQLSSSRRLYYRGRQFKTAWTVSSPTNIQSCQFWIERQPTRL